MAANIEAPDHIAVGTSEGDVVPELTTGQTKRVFLIITNIGIAAATLDLHRYDAGGAESLNANNAIYKSRPVEPNSLELLEISFTLTAGWKVTALASAASSIVIHTDTIDL